MDCGNSALFGLWWRSTIVSRNYRGSIGMRLVQFHERDGRRGLAVLAEDGSARLVEGAATAYELATRAVAEKLSLEALVARLGLGGAVDIRQALAEKRVLAPLDHPDPAHLVVTGTGLTHLGSAEGRGAMDKKLSGGGGARAAPRLQRGSHRSPIPCGCSSWAWRAANRPPDSRGCSRNGSTRAMATVWWRRRRRSA